MTTEDRPADQQPPMIGMAARLLAAQAEVTRLRAEIERLRDKVHPALRDWDHNHDETRPCTEKCPRSQG